MHASSGARVVTYPVVFAKRVYAILQTPISKSQSSASDALICLYDVSRSSFCLTVFPTIAKYWLSLGV